jgi:CRP-like cAMP-binding protein
MGFSPEAQLLIDFFSQYAPLQEVEQQSIADSLTLAQPAQGAILQAVGMPTTLTYFVLRGCLRQYIPLEDGSERTTAFYTEQHITQVPADAAGRATQALVCLESDTLLAVAAPERVESLYAKHPQFAQIALRVVEDLLQAQLQTHAALLCASPTQRYLQLVQTRPSLVARVPQYYIASYLGIQPESLSRIRRRLARGGQ